MANISAAQKARARGPGGLASSPHSIDTATVSGVTGAFAVIAAAMFLGGSPESFVDIPAMLIVFGGTALVTLASFRLEEIRGLPAIVYHTIIYRAENPSDAARRILHLADRARRTGALSLIEISRNIGQSRYLGQAVQLVADGLPVEEIEQVLIHERDATHQRHIRSAGILRKAGEVAPAMGLIGTLVGLVQMLGNLDDPSTIGPSMAVALLTTFYGAILANMLFHPLASKLERNSEIEAAVHEVYTMGAVSISRQENPRRLEVLINTILSPAQRVEYFD